MSDPVIRTCSGTSWACAICACATCCACAARTFVNVNNDAEPIRVASLDVVGFIAFPRGGDIYFASSEIPVRLISGHPHSNRPYSPQRPYSPDGDEKLTGHLL